MTYLCVHKSSRKGQLNLSHGTKNEKSKEGTKNKKLSSSEEMIQVIVCEGSLGGGVQKWKFVKQVDVKPGVKQREGTMNEQSGESNRKKWQVKE